MAESPQELLTQLRRAADAYDRVAMDLACAALIAWAWRASPSDPQAGAVIETVREQRCWRALGTIASALLARGNDGQSVRSGLVQSAIDGGDLELAGGLLQQILGSHADDAELLGLQGRLLKQRFVCAAAQGAGRAACASLLNDALRCYLQVYQREGSLWHGINAVALAKRAQRDGLALSVAFDADVGAQAIFANTSAELAGGRNQAWNYATRLEAAIALGRTHDALASAFNYASASNVGPFSYAATLRELREIWCLDERDSVMRTLTGVLEAKIAALHGGAHVVLQSGAPAPPAKSVALEHVERALAGAEPILSHKGGTGRERVFEGALVALDSLLTGIACSNAIAWLEHAGSRRRVGTGFILSGERLDPRLGSEVLLVTNAHVLDRDTAKGALDAQNAAVFFQQGPNQGRKFSVTKPLWVSPADELDVCVTRLVEPAACALTTVASRLPSLEARSFVYVIGHPSGGALSFSLMDNLLLDYDERLLHYRCATKEGSSGSAVFDFDWQLIGIHHSGLDQMPRLHGRPGTYAANAGTRFDVVRQAFQKEWVP